MELEFSRQFFEKSSNTIFHENPFSGSQVVPFGPTDGQTDITQLIVAFRNFANAPKQKELAKRSGVVMESEINIALRVKTLQCVRSWYGYF